MSENVSAVLEGIKPVKTIQSQSTPSQSAISKKKHKKSIFQSDIEAREVTRLKDTYGKFWYDNLFNMIEGGTINPSQICDYATLLANSISPTEVEQLRDSLIGSKDSNSEIIPYTSVYDKSSIESRFSVMVFESLPRLVQGVIQVNRILPETMFIYANLCDSLFNVHATVLKWIYQCHSVYTSLCDIDNVLDYNIFVDPLTPFSQYPSFSDMSVYTSTKHKERFAIIKEALNLFFMGDLVSAYNELLIGGIELTPSVFKL